MAVKRCLSHSWTGSRALALLSLVARSSLTASPVPLTWSPTTYGPEGPWNAIRVTIGYDQVVDVFPGGEFESSILTPQVCAEAACPLSTTYAPGRSSSAVLNEVGYQPTVAWMNPLNMSGVGNYVFDSISFGYNFGTPVQNASIIEVTSAAVKWPSLAQTLSPGIGLLALGAPAVNQSFGFGAGSEIPAINASVPVNYLYSVGEIPSASFGLHIGSASSSNKIPGSMYWGGYDQSRALNPTAAYSYYSVQGSPLSFTTDLLDIGMDTAVGSSPLANGARTGLLGLNNGTIGASIPVTIDPSTPFMSLPGSTCAAMVQGLPITLTNGLYLWNTNDPNYQKIIKSPTFFSFSFRPGTGASNPLVIKVPLSLLALSLTAPVMSPAVTYFPCLPDTGTPTLGRAFLQAAFFSVNWHNDGSPGNWFLAQAPGPNTPSSPTVVAIDPRDTTITGLEADWVSTWTGNWTPLQGTNGTSTSPAPSSPATSGKASNGGLSTGAQAGIGVGVAVIALLVLGLLALFLLRRRRKTRAQKATSTTSPAVIGTEKTPGYQVSRQEQEQQSGYKGNGKDGYYPPGHQVQPFEADDGTPQRRFEMDGTGRPISRTQSPAARFEVHQ